MRYRLGAACVMDLGDPNTARRFHSETDPNTDRRFHFETSVLDKGVVSRTPYKSAGEWWVEVTVPSEKSYGNGYRLCEVVVRYPKNRVTQLRGRNGQRI